MKLHTERNEIERSGVASETTFRIKTTAKAFDILSSGLYTDPKLAIVRELSCNAYDAHVAANKADVPFEIHLPNSLEPWFHVRDYGTGLSDSDVMSLYTTYFESTKSDSNDFIGALGLGSKSPFSYTKAFEVISRFNGKRRMYSVFINEDGVPTIARLGEIDTDEVNGLEVRITVTSGDFYAFAEKTARALRFFPLKPQVIGYTGFKFLEIPAERLEGKGWKMFESSFVTDYSKMTAVQGNVAYKVDISKLGLNDSDTQLLNKSHIVGFFNIGDLEVAANREEIRYDERSKQALISKIADVRSGVLESIEKQVDALKGKPFWDVTIELNAISKRIFNDRRLFKEFVKDSKNDQIIKYLKNGGDFQLSSLRGHIISVYEQNYGNNGRSVRRKNFGSGITPDTHIAVFYNDLPSGGVARVMEWTRQANKIGDNHHMPIAIVIRPQKDYVETVYEDDATSPGGKLVKKEPWLEKDYADELTMIRSELGDVNFLLTSRDAPIPPRAAGATKTSLPIFQFDGIQGKYNAYIAWKRTTTIDLEAGGLYFALQNGAHISFTDAKGELQNVTWSLSNVEGYLAQAVKLVNEYLDTEYTTKDLYGFGSQAIGKIKKNENWINLFDVLREVVKSYVDAEKYFAALDRTADVHGIRDRTTRGKGKFFTMIRDLDKKSVFRTTLEPLLEGQEKYGKLHETVMFVRKINLDFDLKLFDNNGSGFYAKNAFESYPMLRYIDGLDYKTDKELEVLFDYIKLIDRS